MDNYGNAYAQAKQAQDISPGSLQNLAKQTPMRERVQAVNKRASGVMATLADLTNAVMPPSTLSGLNNGEGQIKDSTLSGDIDDLAQSIAQIEAQVVRLSVAITGAA